MIKDCWSRPLAVGDRVRVSAYGYGARLVDTGVVSTVVELRRTRAVIAADNDGLPRAIGGGCLIKIISEPEGS